MHIDIYLGMKFRVGDEKMLYTISEIDNKEDRMLIAWNYGYGGSDASVYYPNDAIYAALNSGFWKVDIKYLRKQKLNRINY